MDQESLRGAVAVNSTPFNTEKSVEKRQIIFVFLPNSFQKISFFSFILLSMAVEARERQRLQLLLFDPFE